MEIKMKIPKHKHSEEANTQNREKTDYHKLATMLVTTILLKIKVKFP